MLSGWVLNRFAFTAEAKFPNLLPWAQVACFSQASSCMKRYKGIPTTITPPLWVWMCYQSRASEKLGTSDNNWVLMSVGGPLPKQAASFGMPSSWVASWTAEAQKDSVPTLEDVIHCKIAAAFLWQSPSKRWSQGSQAWRSIMIHLQLRPCVDRLPGSINGWSAPSWIKCLNF